jgi:hypothetical protein
VRPLHSVALAKLRCGHSDARHERQADHVAQDLTRKSSGDLRHDARDFAEPDHGQSQARRGRAPEVTAEHGAGSHAAGGQPLPASAREFFEKKLGCDLAHVRVHTDAEAGHGADAMHARAFAMGNDITFAAGQYEPESSRGRRLIAHELTHVLQQRHTEGMLESPLSVQCQNQPGTARFPNFPQLALDLEEDVASNLYDYGHHFYRISMLYPGRTDLLEEALGRYALGANVLETGFGFLGIDSEWSSRLALGTGILFKGLTFATEGELVIDYQLDIGHGLKLETSIDLAMDANDFSNVRKVDVGLGLIGRF